VKAKPKGEMKLDIESMRPLIREILQELRSEKIKKFEPKKG